MVRCSVCGTMLRHDWEGVRDKETGAFICDGCYTPELHPDLDDEEKNIPDDGVQEEWHDRWKGRDAYDETDKTAKHTDIGEVE